MIGSWATEVRREYMGFDARFDLPVRPLGWARLVGVVLVGFGLAFIWTPARELWRQVDRLFDATPAGAEAVFSLFQIPFVLVGSLPLVIGLLILAGRCRVEWKDGRLRATEVLGPLRWTRRLPRQAIRRLGVMAASGSDSGRPGALASFCGLFAEYEGGRRRTVVLGYPRSWLVALATELQTLIGASGSGAAGIEVEVLEPAAPGDDDGADREVVQPAASRVHLEQWSSGLRLTVPPAGLWRGSKGLFLFGLFWCSFMAVFTAFAATGDVEWDGASWVLFLFIAGFWAVGLGLLAGAVNLGRRTAVITVEGGRLHIATRGVLGRREREWNPGEVSAVRADASGMEVNDRPVLELQVHRAVGGKVGFLAGRDDEELRWMAASLRLALDVPARPSPP
jgi:hypothetical protein